MQKMDTKHDNDMKQKHDTICNHGKHINKRDKEIRVGRHTNIKNSPSHKRVQMIITNTNE